MRNLESSLMEDQTDTYALVEERQVSMNSENPTLRNAHFLKPVFSDHHDHFPPPPSPLFSSKPRFKKLEKYDMHSYKAYPSEKWNMWVHSLKPKYQEIWKQAGIYEAILASTYKTPKHKELIIGLAERWYAETNTFVFPWGEVTITLEDVMSLGGYSVLGALYLTPLPDECVGILDSLKNAYRELKSFNHVNVTGSIWMEYFMSSGEELEHEAFLAMWLSRFVLVRSYANIVIHDFHVAVHLSRGKRIALAPVVLASIYRDMGLLHNSLLESVELKARVRQRFVLSHSDLVHMWAWERFPELRPTPNVVGREEPRSAWWNGVRVSKVRDVRAALDSGKESFIWRPYVTSCNCLLSKLYKDNEQWVVIESDDIESLARCLRVSELIGLDCIEQYLPHRVAMQFGLDQDVPPLVMRFNESAQTAWKSYNRSVTGMKLYIPPRISESDVSSRYVVWWRGLLPLNVEMPTVSWVHKRRRSGKSLSRNTEGSGQRNDVEDTLVLATHFEPETPAKLICMTEGGTSRARSVSSSDKSEERTSSIERPKYLKEDAVVSGANKAEVSNANVELPKDEVASTSNCPKTKIVNIEDESLPHMGLMDRIMRLESIVDAIKAAKN